ncbi:hypothetical protein COY26_02225 [Candidatus Woesearchaeota archaeon CG_4_10_14_0_2_um_filter_33_10]|nr:MAG: hypothetical protein COV14_01365 [Candidatus Woesearchaeota archaeon CG10_big_fil_rev_8_21_14_0_10_33_12]PIU72514.1 MAG: hypothetical protein COS79_02545 [Candidatus Woesearchaeota archaeon CG06_land_8_20_14_3_00_33_13]PIZ53353.1 MAG: hypothetical protein COY26_02225 [Candidatus Woesearchaeota archaeon CG_4_10_14_0_2_um_filter_33_10]
MVVIIRIIITMAGEGIRFKKAGYLIPKHMIKIKDKTMFEWAMLTLKDFYGEEFIFVTLEKNNDLSFINEKCKLLGIKKRKIVSIDNITSGQAETVLKAEKEISLDEPILIYNVDTYVEPYELRKTDIKGYGFVPCFKANGTHWSFVKFDSNKRIFDITEKVRISEYASIGLYYFCSFSLFKKCFGKYYSQESKEKYIAPIYNILIKDNKEVYTSILDSKKVHILGTPEEVKSFEEK